jgi:hypothetical protein
MNTVHPFVRLLCSAVILSGFALGGCVAAGIVILIHDNDAPWMVQDRIYPWDGYGVGIIVALIGVIGSVRAFRRPRLDTPTWSLLGIASCILFLFLVALLASIFIHGNA